MLGWAFIHDGSAIVIEASSMTDALLEYLSDWYPDAEDLQIVPVKGHSGYNICDD